MSAVTDKVAQLRALGLAALQRNDNAAALAALRIVATLTPSDAGAAKAYAVALIRANQHKEASAVLLRLLARAPDDIEAHCVVGELSFTMMRYVDAETHLLKCVKLDPKAETPHGVRARMLIRRMQKQLESTS